MAVLAGVRHRMSRSYPNHFMRTSRHALFRMTEMLDACCPSKNQVKLIHVESTMLCKSNKLGKGLVLARPAWPTVKQSTAHLHTDWLACSTPLPRKCESGMITWSALKHSWIWPPLLLLALLTLLARLCRLLPLFVVRELFWPSCSSPSAASSASSPSSSSSWSEPHWLRGVVPAMNQMNWVKALKPAGRFQNYICLLITIIVFFFINCFLESTLANPSRTTSDRKTQTRLPGRLS